MTTGRPPNELFRLDDRVVIITGGVGLLGTSHSQMLAQAGARVVIADLRGDAAQALATQLVDQGLGAAIGIQVDVSDPSSVSAMVEQVLRQFGRIDVLVNNAALDPKFDPVGAQENQYRFEDYPIEAWNAAVAVNISGMFLCAQAVARPMLEQEEGVMVNVSSTYGVVGPDQRLYQREGEPERFKPVSYSVSKAAALGLTRYLASYFEGTRIRVNALTPGGVFADHDDEFVQRYSSKAILGRMAEKQEISSALLFLVSEASSYMTGANLVVDGGWTAW